MGLAAATSGSDKTATIGTCSRDRLISNDRARAYCAGSRCGWGLFGHFYSHLGWSGGAMVLGKLPVPGCPTILIRVGQGPTALTVGGAGGGCLDIFTLIYPFYPLSPSPWETARYRLKYCLKGPLNPKQPTNQPISNEIYDYMIKYSWILGFKIFNHMGSGLHCLFYDTNEVVFLNSSLSSLFYQCHSR